MDRGAAPSAMSHLDRPPLHRRLIPWIMGALYGFVCLIAAYYVYELRDSQRVQVIEQLETLVQDQVAVWEDELLATLTEWMDIAVSTHDRAALRQAQMRAREPWFNGLYIWTHAGDPRLRSPGSGPTEPTFLFPPPPVEETQTLTSRLCLGIANRMKSDPRLTPMERARAYVDGCSRESLAVRLYAASEAANILHDVGMTREALAIIEGAGLPDNLTLAAAAQRGIPPHRVFVLRLQRANAHLALGNEEEGLAMLFQLGNETAMLDAPEAKPLVDLARYWILRELRNRKRADEADRLALQLSKVERRVAAYNEIKDRILQRTGLSTANEAPRFIYDQYSEAPFLLYYGWAAGGDYGVALQLEQSVLLAEFLNVKSLARLKRHIVITDSAGNYVAGSKRGGPTSFTVPFPRTLTHLRVGVREEAVTSRLERNRNAWLTPLAILGMAALLGVVALAVQVQANRQQVILLRRQRDFTTRVTHELKTPLAGIRVMAENLEAGAFKDDRQLQDMARRIVEEADRLTTRVDEVLAVARDRSVPDPEPFDPEEPVLEAIDQWGPRLEQAGVSLHADLHPTDEVRGDAAAVRDAISCLLDNALKYRREDRDDARVWLTLEQQGSWIQVAVTDNGIGVPADMRDAIFDRFVRVEGPNRGKAGGHGLGLSQVAAIAKAHRGDIRCVEGVDGGARFILRLPAIKS